MVGAILQNVLVALFCNVTCIRYISSKFYWIYISIHYSFVFPEVSGRKGVYSPLAPFLNPPLKPYTCSSHYSWSTHTYCLRLTMQYN